MCRDSFKNLAIMAILAGSVLSDTAQASLIVRSGGMVYDSYSNITWLQDMAYAKTLTEERVNQIVAAVPWVGGLPVEGGNFARDLSGNFTGRMIWRAAWAWADQLTYAGYDDWRLPSAMNRDGSGPCFDWDCSDSEIGHLFYIDGGLSSDQSFSGSEKLMSTFKNVQDFGYWLGPIPEMSQPYKFDTRIGYQNENVGHGSLFAWAVRSGDVPAPATGTLTLIGLGVAGIMTCRQMKRRAPAWRNATFDGRRRLAE